MRTRQPRLAILVLFLVPALWGCPGDDQPAGDLPEATAADPAAAEQAMQTVLTRVVEAQHRHFEAHNRFADSVPALEEFGFRPVEDTHVTLGFQGTEPQWGYLATAIHTFSNERCEVLHGRATDGREYAGHVECTADGATGPQPALPQGQTGAGTPGAAPPGATGTAQPGATGTAPQGTTQPGTTVPGT